MLCLLMLCLLIIGGVIHDRSDNRTFRSICGRVSDKRVEPGFFFKYFVEHQSRLSENADLFGIDEHGGISFEIPSRLGTSSAEGALARRYAEWEEWDDAIFFAKIALNENSNDVLAADAILDNLVLVRPRPAKSIIDIDTKTFVPDRLLVRTQMKYWLVKEDFTRALDIYNATENSASKDYSEKGSLIPILMIWYADQKQVSQMNTHLDEFTKRKAYEYMKGHMTTNSNTYVLGQIVLALAYAYHFNKDIGNVEYQNKWKREGADLLVILEKLRPDDAWVNLFLSKKLE